MSKKSDLNYRVGYRRPPSEHQFRPGQSGNPAGRPKGVRNIRTELFEELNESVSILDGANRIEVSKARAIVKTLITLAIAGDPRAIATVIQSCAQGQDDTPETEAPEDRRIMEAVAGYRQKRTTPAPSGSSSAEGEATP
jgi:hypothetical protein